MAKAKVKTYLDHIMLRVEGATDEVLHALALQIEGTTKRNIVSNDQIDTGFMLNSVYVESEKGSTFGATWGDPGDLKAPRLGLPRTAKAAVIVGAIYAIFQEILNPFLRPAGDEVAGQAKGISESIFRRLVRD